MNTKLIIWIVGTLLGVIAIAAIWYFFFAPKPAPPPAPAPTTTLPISGSVTPVTSKPSFATSSTPGILKVAARDGGAVTATDFIHNGVTLPDAANKGRYLLAGDLGYCATNVEKCQAGPTTDFNIFYDSTDGTFTIALLKEPLGQVRLEMEQFLTDTLGITQKEMCRLDYYVGTTYDINTLYASKNLGFSFCPNATPLPK